MVKPESLYDTSWKLFRYYPNQIEAALAVQLLGEAGIPCYKLDGSIGVHLPGLGGSKVFVRACDLDEASRCVGSDDGTGQDESGTGQDESGTGQDESGTGQDESGTGQDESGTGQDESENGDKL